MSAFPAPRVTYWSMSSVARNSPRRVAQAQAHADGHAVHDAVVAHGEAAAGGVPAGEQALDGLEALALHLLLSGDQQTRRGHKRPAAHAFLAHVAVVGAARDGPHGLGVAAEFQVLARVVGLVPLLDRCHGVGLHAGLHAHVVAELLHGVGAVHELAGGVVALGAGSLDVLEVGGDGGRGVGVPLLGGQVPRQLVEEHLLPVGAPDEVGAVARLARAGAAGEQRAAESLVAVALAVLVQPQALHALHGRQRDEGVAAHVAAGATPPSRRCAWPWRCRCRRARTWPGSPRTRPARSSRGRWRCTWRSSTRCRRRKAPRRARCTARSRCRRSSGR